MELYLKVRLAVSEGMTQRQAAKHFNISRDSVALEITCNTSLNTGVSFSALPVCRRQREMSGRYRDLKCDTSAQFFGAMHLCIVHASS